MFTFRKPFRQRTVNPSMRGHLRDTSRLLQSLERHCRPYVTLILSFIGDLHSAPPWSLPHGARSLSPRPFQRKPFSVSPPGGPNAGYTLSQRGRSDSDRVRCRAFPGERVRSWRFVLHWSQDHEKDIRDRQRPRGDRAYVGSERAAGWEVHRLI